MNEFQTDFQLTIKNAFEHTPVSVLFVHNQFLCPSSVFFLSDLSKLNWQSNAGPGSDPAPADT